MEEKIRLKVEVTSSSSCSKLQEAAQGLAVLKSPRIRSPSLWGPVPVLTILIFPYIQMEFPLLQFVPAISYPGSVHL